MEIISNGRRNGKFNNRGNGKFNSSPSGKQGNVGGCATCNDSRSLKLYNEDYWYAKENGLSLPVEPSLTEEELQHIDNFHVRVISENTKVHLDILNDDYKRAIEEIDRLNDLIAEKDHEINRLHDRIGELQQAARPLSRNARRRVKRKESQQSDASSQPKKLWSELASPKSENASPKSDDEKDTPDAGEEPESQEITVKSAPVTAINSEFTSPALAASVVSDSCIPPIRAGNHYYPLHAMSPVAPFYHNMEKINERLLVNGRVVVDKRNKIDGICIAVMLGQNSIMRCTDAVRPGKEFCPLHANPRHQIQEYSE